MENPDNKKDILFGFKNPHIEKLAVELASLPENFGLNTPAHARSLEIIEAFDAAKLSFHQKGQVLSHMRYHWTNAAGVADQMGLGIRRPDHCDIGRQLSGLCLVQSSLGNAQAMLRGMTNG